jgi:hypothetical protein
MLLVALFVVSEMMPIYLLINSELQMFVTPVDQEYPELRLEA